MKTTVEIADPLFHEVKRYAAAHEVTFREVVEAGLRELLSSQSHHPFKLKERAFKGEGAVQDHSWPEVRSIIYDGRGE